MSSELTFFINYLKKFKKSKELEELPNAGYFNWCYDIFISKTIEKICINITLR